MNTPHPESVRKKTGAERRRWARVSSDMPITLQTPRGAVQARMRDVSRAGVCFYMDQPLPLMTMLQLDLPLGQDHGFGIETKVQAQLAALNGFNNGQLGSAGLLNADQVAVVERRGAQGSALGIDEGQ